MRFVLKFIVAPLVLVLFVEWLFALGIWEPLTQPQSHAGSSIAKKRALAATEYAHVDYVTIGSSRGVYGIDHEALAASARERGEVYANLTMPGTHWMTVDVLTDWLARNHPEIKGGILALAVQDFISPGNGSYELGIVYPFHRFGDIPQMSEHVAFKRDTPATYGLYSALFEYRDDVQEFLRDPKARFKTVGWARRRAPDELLASNPHKDADMCRFGLDSMSACTQVSGVHGGVAEGLQTQCAQMTRDGKQRPNMLALAREPTLPQSMRTTRDLVQARLRALRWPRPPIVLLMPTAHVWDSISPIGLHAWTLQILQPLADEGTIRLIDATDALDDAEGKTDCSTFFDFYHQNDTGRARLMQRVLPELESFLFDDGASVKSRP